MTTMIVWLLIGYSTYKSAAPSTLGMFPDEANCLFVAKQLPKNAEIGTRSIKAQIVVPK